MTSLSPDPYRNQYEELLSLLNAWARLGTKAYPAGTLRIGHVPDVAPEGDLHQLFSPLSVEGIATLEEHMGRFFPPSLVAFLRLHNGISTFQDHVNIYGLRTSYRRTDFDDMMEQPFDMVSSNSYGRRDTPHNVIFIGGLRDGQQKAAVWPDGTISLWNEKQAQARIPDLRECLQFCTYRK